MSCFSHSVNSVPTQTSIHARRVVSGSVCGADLSGRWSNSGRWWGFCQTAWLLTRLLLLFNADNQFASVQGGATQCCSEVENKEILKMCNQNCFLDSIRSLGTTATFSWRRGSNTLTSTFKRVWVHSKLQRIVGHGSTFDFGRRSSTTFWCWVTLKMSENPCLDVLSQCSAFSFNRFCNSRLWFVGILSLQQTSALTCKTFYTLILKYPKKKKNRRILKTFHVFRCRILVLAYNNTKEKKCLVV